MRNGGDENLDGNFVDEMGLETQRKTQELSRMSKAVNLNTGLALAHFLPLSAFEERTTTHVCAFNVDRTNLTINCRTAIRR